MDKQAPPETPWYSVPLLWLGIAILLLSLAGSIHLILISQDYVSQESTHSGSAGKDTTEPSHSFRGMPLTRPPQPDARKAQ